MEWRIILDIYKVSSTGRTKREDGYMVRADGRVRYMKGREIVGKLNKGYRIVSLQVNNKSKGFSVHRLVALAFIDNPLNLPEVNHKNGIRNDNRVENLEWSSHKDNMNHARYVLKRKMSSGHKRIVCLNDNREFESIGSAARFFGISKSNIANVLRGSNKHTGGLKFKYATL